MELFDRVFEQSLLIVSKYDNFIDGKFVKPIGGKYFDNVSPIDGKVFTQTARSDGRDIDAAIDAASKAFKTWGKTSTTERSNILLKIADVIEKNLPLLAAVETVAMGSQFEKQLMPISL